MWVGVCHVRPEPHVARSGGELREARVQAKGSYKLTESEGDEGVGRRGAGRNASMGD